MTFPKVIIKKYIAYFLLLIAVIFCNHSNACDIDKTKKIEKSNDSQNIGCLKAKPFDCAIKSEKGENFLISDFKGKVVIITFFTTWCPNCPAALEASEALIKKFNGNIKIIALNIGNDSVDAIKAHYKANNLQMLDVYHSISSRAVTEIRKVPTCLVLDKKGNIALKYIGAIDHNSEEFIEFITKLAK